MLYRAASPEMLRLVPLDDLTVAYHRPAGATHLLAEPAPQIIAALQANPCGLNDLIARFEVSPDVGSSRVDLQACKLEYSIVSPK